VTDRPLDLQHSKALDAALTARTRGQQFVVRLRALNQASGMILSDFELRPGDQVVLQLLEPSRNPSYKPLQMFARVAREYAERRAYVVQWERLVSPLGTGPLLQILQSGFGICMDMQCLPGAGLADNEIVYFDFGSREMHSPSRVVPVAGPSPASRPRPPSEAGKPAVARPRPTPTDAATTAEIVEEGDKVSVFGLNITKSSWDKLEELETVYDAGDGRGRTKQKVSKPPAPAAEQKPEREARRKPGKLAGLLHKLAGKLVDNE
jgi:hypothetical protein